MYRIVLYDRSVVCAEGIYTCTCMYIYIHVYTCPHLLEMLSLANSSGGKCIIHIAVIGTLSGYWELWIHA